MVIIIGKIQSTTKRGTILKQHHDKSETIYKAKRLMRKNIIDVACKGINHIVVICRNV